MYGNITLIALSREENKPKNRGFTLVEIMIVIVIIVLLTQLGNLNSLFETRERNKIEEIAVKITAALEEEKTHALLGKTQNGKIVRKRRVDIDFDTDNTITLTSSVNLVETDATTYDPDSRVTMSWSLPELEIDLYECTKPVQLIDVKKIGVSFTQDTIEYDTPPGTSPHILIALSNTDAAHEIHIDRRTGLTYEQKLTEKNSDGTWQIQCN